MPIYYYYFFFKQSNLECPNVFFFSPPFKSKEIFRKQCTKGAHLSNFLAILDFKCAFKTVPKTTEFQEKAVKYNILFLARPNKDCSIEIKIKLTGIKR